MSRLSGIAALVTILLQSTPVLAQHEVRDWKEMAPCKAGGHVYVASQLWIDSDPKRAFAVNTVGLAVMDLAKVIKGAAEPLLIKDAELVDGFISSTGHWALVRSANPELLKAELPACKVQVTAPPPPKKGCRDWAYPHSTIAGETVTAAVGIPIAKRQLEEVRREATEMMKMLLTLTLDAKVTERGTSMKSNMARAFEDLNIQTHVCGDTFWAMGIGRRAKPTK